MESSDIIVNAKLSNCCSASISVHYGTAKKEHHSTCNKCKKECSVIVIPKWKLVFIKGKYGFKQIYKELVTI